VSVRSNLDLNTSALLSGVGATTSQTSADQVNAYGRGVKVFVVTTAIGTGSITVTIQAKDPGSGSYTTLLASAAITTNTTTVLTVYPGIAVAANVSANDVLPRQWRISLAANNANPANYSVGASVIV
jgi:hypothetical protein